VGTIHSKVVVKGHKGGANKYKTKPGDRGKNFEFLTRVKMNRNEDRKQNTAMLLSSKSSGTANREVCALARWGAGEVESPKEKLKGGELRLEK